MINDAAGDMALGSTEIVRLLIVSSGSEVGGHSMRRLQEILDAAGHEVATSSHADWQAMLTVQEPEVVLLDVGTKPSGAALETAAELCSQLKSKLTNGVPVVALLALSRLMDKEIAKAWDTLSAAGADDLLNCDAGQVEVEAHISLLARFADLNGDLALAREQLGKHLQVDEVTQLMTRRFFFQAAYRECSRARRYDHRLSCLMIDIDFLDNFAKKYGEGCADYVLRAVAYIVRQWTRDSDTVARFGEHKIVVLLPETSIENATLVREKISKAVRETKFEYQQEELPISVSIGEAERRRREQKAAPPATPTPAISTPVAVGPADADDATGEDAEPVETSSLSVREELAELLEDADAALTIAKTTARRPDVFVEYTPGASDPSDN